MDRSLKIIAVDIRNDWKKINYAALPYLEAMETLDKISDNFGADSGASIVLYFVSNASSWRGDVARRIKAELKDMADRYFEEVYGDR